MNKYLKTAISIIVNTLSTYVIVVGISYIIKQSMDLLGASWIYTFPIVVTILIQLYLIKYYDKLTNA
jgi:uncharacterized membrane protein YozB (DUF420 family)